MTDPTPPSRRDRFRPIELVGLSFGVAVFTGLVVLLGSREPTLSVIFAGCAFIVALIGLAMMALIESSGPPEDGGPVLEPRPVPPTMTPPATPPAGSPPTPPQP